MYRVKTLRKEAMLTAAKTRQAVAFIPIFAFVVILFILHIPVS